MYETKEEKDYVILVGVENDDDRVIALTAEESLDELEALADTAGAETVGKVLQKRERAHPKHYVGKGKVEEIKLLADTQNATAIVCDDELSPTQIRNLEAMLDMRVLDRTALILDIFAYRAHSAEGKLQVELAQQKYRLTHLTGKGVELSRLGGGIGTRGPGEKKLETDRRHIRLTIGELEDKLKEVETQREVLRKSRDRTQKPVVSMVGYTNAGKSTLLNTLTDAGVLAEDKLFATLDTTTRKVKLPGGSEIQLTDTVGFIHKLPHQLVKAFRSTLDELKYADILLHVVDASHENREEQMETVYSTLRALGCGEKPVITAFNKIDRDVEMPLPRDDNARKVVSVSAATGEGLDQLQAEIEELLKSCRTLTRVLIPYTNGQMLGIVHGKCEIVEENHLPQGVEILAYLSDEVRGKLENWII